MTTSFTRGSAKIYEFPARGRFAVSGHRDDAESAATLSLVAKVAFGSAWYHEEAVQEAERASKN